MADRDAVRPRIGAISVDPVRGLRRPARRGGVSLALALAASACLSSNIAFAQIVPPTGVQPPTRESVERGVAEGTLNRSSPVSVDTSAVERAPCPLAAPDFAGIRLKLTSVTFGGMGDLPGFDLSSSYAEYIGIDQPVSVICEIRDRAATALRQAGYLAAVQVPPQKIESGAVKLDVLLAHLKRVQIKGDPGASEGILLKYLNKLTQDPVFNTHTAERYLLLAKDVPGLDVRLALRPLEGSPGEVVGEVSVRRVPVYAELGLQNYGSRSVGRYNLLARAQLNGLTGLGDATTLSFFSTTDLDEQKVLQIGHDMRLGGEGFMLHGDFTYGWTNPTVTGTTPDFHSRTLSASFEGAYPVVRSQSYNMSVALGGQIANQALDLGSLQLSRDRLRVLYGRVETSGIAKASLTGRDGFTPFEPHWSWGLVTEVRQGLNIWDATNDCSGADTANPCQPSTALGVKPSRDEGTAKGFVVRASGVFDYRPVRALTLSLQPRAQYSPDKLLSYEEFSGGNYTIGGGYDPGAIIGDSGVGVRGEVRIGSLIPRVAGGNALQPYGFIDAAWVWNHDSDMPDDPQKIVSVGGGLRAAIHDAIRLDVGVAVPLRETPGTNVKGKARFMLNLSFQLLPWRL